MADQRNASPNTIRSYRDTFVLLLRYLRDGRDHPIEKVTLANIDAPTVVAFLEHLQAKRESSPRTCNQRLAAIHAFARYVQSEVGLIRSRRHLGRGGYDGTDGEGTEGETTEA
jgi:site-specific recombinase XerD